MRSSVMRSNLPLNARLRPNVPLKQGSGRKPEPARQEVISAAICASSSITRTFASSASLFARKVVPRTPRLIHRVVDGVERLVKMLHAPDEFILRRFDTQRRAGTILAAVVLTVGRGTIRVVGRWHHLANQLRQRRRSRSRLPRVELDQGELGA